MGASTTVQPRGHIREYTLTHCPVLVDLTSSDEDAAPEIVECGADLTYWVAVHEDGAEYGVTVYNGCGHTQAEMAHDIQYGLLGLW